MSVLCTGVCPTLLLHYMYSYRITKNVHHNTFILLSVVLLVVALVVYNYRITKKVWQFHTCFNCFAWLLKKKVILSKLIRKLLKYQHIKTSPAHIHLRIKVIQCMKYILAIQYIPQLASMRNRFTYSTRKDASLIKGDHSINLCCYKPPPFCGSIWL